MATCPFCLSHKALAVHEIEEAELDLGKIPSLVTWRVDSALPKDLALLDETALACLAPDEWESRRWLHFSSRYLGRLAQGLRLLASNREFAARFIEEVDGRVKSGEIAAAVEIHSYFRGTQDMHRFAPTKT